MHNTIRIAIVGAFCSGKTTLVNDLHLNWPHSAQVPDECRPVLDAIPSVDWKVRETRDYLIVRQILVESVESVEREGEAPVFIDGGVVNNIAHDRLLLDTPPPRRELLECFSYRMYDAAIWCGYEDIDLVSDGQRFEDGSMRVTLDRHVGDVLSEFVVPHLRLTGAREDRLARATEFLKERI